MTVTALGEDCARKGGTGIALKVVLGACESGWAGLCSVTDKPSSKRKAQQSHHAPMASLSLSLGTPGMGQVVGKGTPFLLTFL